MSTIFTKIVNNEIPSYKVEENQEFLAFLDAMPLVEGHTLVIPKKEEDFIFDLEDENYASLWVFAKKIAKRLQKTYPTKRIAVAVVGLEVAHAHIHLVPIEKMEDLNFKNQRLVFSPEQYQQIVEKINAHR